MSIEHVLGLFGQYGYWIIFTAILLDNAGLPIPGELLLLIFGGVAGQGGVHPGVGVIVAAAAAVGGDSVGYWLGRLTGPGVLRAYCRATLGSETCVWKAVRYYKRYGTLTVILGRFVMGVRVVLSPLAGSARMPFTQFLLVDSVGALIWSGLYILVGYSFGGRLEGLRQGYRAWFTVIVGALGVAAAAFLIMKLRRRRRAIASNPRSELDEAISPERSAETGTDSGPPLPGLVSVEPCTPRRATGDERCVE